MLLLNISRTTLVSRYQKGKTRKVKTNLDLLETVSGSGICWAICKSAPHPRQPRQYPTTQFFTGWMPFLPPKQQHQSTESKSYSSNLFQLASCLWYGGNSDQITLWIMQIYGCQNPQISESININLARVIMPAISPCTPKFITIAKVGAPRHMRETSLLHGI